MEFELFILGAFLGGCFGIIAMALFTLNTIDSCIEEKQAEENEKIIQMYPDIRKKGGKGNE